MGSVIMEEYYQTNVSGNYLNITFVALKANITVLVMFLAILPKYWC